uniref:Uncharacterized protein n=1 Tax=Arundo donax TaxID=35708 RepID=A0A0A8ZX17_ARUDO
MLVCGKYKAFEEVWLNLAWVSLCEGERDRWCMAISYLS